MTTALVSQKQSSCTLWARIKTMVRILLFDLCGGGPPLLVGLVAQRPDARRRQRVRHRGCGRLRRRLCRRRGHLLLCSMNKGADGRPSRALKSLQRWRTPVSRAWPRRVALLSVRSSTHPPLFQFFCFDSIQRSRGLPPLDESFPLKTTQPHENRAADPISLVYLSL